MKSHHPDYLEGFVKTCMAYGLDEEASTMILNNARHKDYLENSSDYREGFQNGLCKNSFVAFAKKFLPVAAGAGAYGLSQPIYQGVRNNLSDWFSGYREDKGYKNLMKENKLPDLKPYVESSLLRTSGNQWPARDALSAMRYGDAALVGGFAPSSKPSMPALLSQRNAIRGMLQRPIDENNITEFGRAGELYKKDLDLSKRIQELERMQSVSEPIFQSKLKELKKLHSKLMQGEELSARDQAKYEQLSQFVPRMSEFRKNVNSLYR